MELPSSFNQLIPDLITLKNFFSALAGVAPLIGVLFFKLKSHGFDSQSGHVLGLQVWSLVGAQTIGFLTHINVSPPPPFPLPLLPSFFLSEIKHVLR